MLQETNSTVSRVSIPVALVLEKQMIQGKFWSLPSWQLEAVLVGPQFDHEEAAGEQLEQGAGKNDNAQNEYFLWSGFRVVLYRDACERYWHALIGERPLVYTVLREDEADGTIEPLLVTIDYDEATAHSETDAQVLTADIPRQLYEPMEAFVLEHYKPVEFKKRKRKKWSEKDAHSGPDESVWSDYRRFRRTGYHN